MQKVKTKSATVKAVLRKNYTSEKGEHPAKIQIYYGGVAKYYPIDFEGRPVMVSPNDWALINEKKCPKNLQGVKVLVNRLEATALAAMDRITRDGKLFSWERFNNEFVENDSSKGFLKLFKEHLAAIRDEGRIGTYKSYQNAYNSFHGFRDGKELSPSDLTTALLKSYESHLQKGGCNKTTIGIYARALKVVYNIAADKNPSLLESYPFARKQTDRSKYKIKRGSGRKGEALSIEQLQKFIALSPDPISLEYEAKQYWLFSFFCQGMNMKDIFLLKYQDIKGESIQYVRAKTKDTEAQESVMLVPLSESIRQIIVKLGNPEKRPANYVFPVIPNGIASTVQRRTENIKSQAERIDEIIRQKIKMINARIKNLCISSEDPNLKDLKITTYWARHTYASLLKEAGESVELIRELLGHSDIRTTEAYLKRFDFNKKKAVNEKIESLLKVS
jgi:integrase/recombinase XerD